MPVFPNLIIAGVHKAGTTSLYSYLARHPQICASFKKEIGFFVPLMYGREIPEPEEYGRHFRHCVAETFRLEASPSYIYGREAIAERMKEMIDDARVIVILRDPADRLVSYFSRAVADSMLPAGIGFGDYLARSVESIDSSEHDPYTRGFREGLYIRYLPAWQRVFGDNFKVVFFDDLRAAATDLAAGICRWLGLDGSFYATQELEPENRTVDYRNRWLHRHVKTLYMKNEAFWRRNEWLRTSLRKAYNKVNVDAREAREGIDDRTLANLRELYLPHNRELRTFLVSHGYESLPGWLG